METGGVVGTKRGTSNGNAAGSSEARRRRKAWLVATYRADRDVLYAEFRDSPLPVHTGVHDDSVPACRCYRCGTLLTIETVTVDRIVPGCQGGTYRRSNIRPACASCNSVTGGATRGNSR